MFLDPGRRFDVVSQNDGSRGRGQEQIRFVDQTGRGGHDLDFDLVRAERRKEVAQDLDRTLDVGLENKRQILCFALLDLLEQVVQGGRRGLLAAFLGRPGEAEIDDGLGFLGVGCDLEEIAGLGDLAETEDLHGCRRTGRFEQPTLLITEGPDASIRCPGDEGVARNKRAVLDDDRGQGAFF